MKAKDKVKNIYDGLVGIVESTYLVDLYDGIDYSPKRKAAKINKASGGWICGTLSELRNDGWRIVKIEKNS